METGTPGAGDAECGQLAGWGKGNRTKNHSAPTLRREPETVTGGFLMRALGSGSPSQFCNPRAQMM